MNGNSDDFSPSTHLAHSQLVHLHKTHNMQFNLKFDKLICNNKTRL